MAGLLDFLQTPAGTGLLSGVASYAMNARRGTPVNNLGRGLAGGLTGYAQSQEDILRKQQLDETKQMRDMELQIKQTQLDQLKNQQQWKAGLPGVLAQSQPKVEPFQPDTFDQADNPFGQMANVQQGNPQALQDYLMKAESPFADKIMEKQLFPKEKEGFTLGEGQSRFGGDGQVIANVAKAPEKIDYNKAFLPDGTPNLPYQKFKLTDSKAGATNVQTNYPTQEKEQSKEYGKSMGELRGIINKSGFEGPSKLAQLDRMEQLLDGVSGGKLAPLGAEIASGAQSFGIKIDPKLGNKEASEALTREIASALRKPGTGPMTDKDYDNFMMQVPSLSKTPAGRKQITSTLRAAIKRDMEAAKFARAYAKGNGGVIDDNYFDELAGFYAKNPVVTPNKAPAAATRAVNPTTGEVIEMVNGKWQKAK